MHLTTIELAQRLRTNVTTLAMWRVRGQGPKFIKAGRKVLYPLAEIEKWENDKLRQNTADYGV